MLGTLQRVSAVGQPAYVVELGCHINQGLGESEPPLRARLHCRNIATNPTVTFLRELKMSADREMLTLVQDPRLAPMNLRRDRRKTWGLRRPSGNELG